MVLFELLSSCPLCVTGAFCLASVLRCLHVSMMNNSSNELLAVLHYIFVLVLVCGTDKC